MSDRPVSIPEACRRALAAIEADPLDLPEEARRHLRTCPACTEARVQWLAQEDAPAVLAPAGYFERLPGRVLRKLPYRRPAGLRQHPWLLAAAAALALAIGVAGYLAGKVQKAPVVEASVPASTFTDPSDFLSETPFQDNEDAMTQFSTLSPEEANAVLARLESARATKKP